MYSSSNRQRREHPTEALDEDPEFDLEEDDLDEDLAAARRAGDYAEEEVNIDLDGEEEDENYDEDLDPSLADNAADYHRRWSHLMGKKLRLKCWYAFL